MTSDLSLYLAMVLFLLTVSELPLPVLWLPYLLPEDALQWCPAEAPPDFIILALSISHHFLTTKLRHLRQI